MYINENKCYIFTKMKTTVIFSPIVLYWHVLLKIGIPKNQPRILICDLI